MTSDRYLKGVLTIIALELGWIALTHTAVPARAQADAMPVVIAGIELQDDGAYLPVAVLGQSRTIPRELAGMFQPVEAEIRNQQPLRVSVPIPVDVRTIAPVTIESDKPLRVEQVAYTPAQRPGD